MSVIDIDFGHSRSSAIADLGLKILSAHGVLSLDQGSWFEAPSAVLAKLSQGSLVTIGAFASLAGGSIGNVRIGRYTSIGPGVVIGAHEHALDWLTTSRAAHYPQMHDWHLFCGRERAGEIVANRRAFAGSCPVTEIGNDVWIGDGVFIKAGVKIGDGAVIGARSVVAKDVEPYTVVVGVPAKARKLRFDEQLVQRLLAFKWWRYSIYDLVGTPFEDPRSALDHIEELVAKQQLQEYRPQRYTPEDLRAIVKKSEAKPELRSMGA